MLADGDADADADPVLAGVVEPPVADVELELLEQPAAASAASTATETPNTAGLRPLR
jgi:hypothetical protein